MLESWKKDAVCASFSKSLSSYLNLTIAKRQIKRSLDQFLLCIILARVWVRDTAPREAGLFNVRPALSVSYVRGNVIALADT